MRTELEKEKKTQITASDYLCCLLSHLSDGCTGKTPGGRESKVWSGWDGRDGEMGGETCIRKTVGGRVLDMLG